LVDFAMLGILGSRHISFNGLWLPANVAVQQVRRACVSLHANTFDRNWPSSNLGSAFLYRYRGRQFCLFSKHQLSKNWNGDQVCVHLANDRSRLFTGGRLIEFSRGEGAREEYDLCALEMPWRLPVQLNAPIWFEAKTGELRSFDELEVAFTIGYPSKLTEIDGEEQCEGVHLSQVLVWAEKAIGEPGRLSVLQLLPGAVMVPQCFGDFDGFSGSPVFGINIATRAIEFLGIVIRGGYPRLFFVPLTWVHRLCEIGLREPAIDLTAA
jgi:hypothetical protein